MYQRQGAVNLGICIIGTTVVNNLFKWSTSIHYADTRSTSAPAANLQTEDANNLPLAREATGSRSAHLVLLVHGLLRGKFSNGCRSLAGKASDWPASTGNVDEAADKIAWGRAVRASRGVAWVDPLEYFGIPTVSKAKV